MFSVSVSELLAVGSEYSDVPVAPVKKMWVLDAIEKETSTIVYASALLMAAP